MAGSLPVSTGVLCALGHPCMGHCKQAQLVSGPTKHTDYKSTIENRDTVGGARSRHRRCREGEVWGGSIPLPSWPGVWESVVSSPVGSEVSLPQNGFGAF